MVLVSGLYHDMSEYLFVSMLDKTFEPRGQPSFWNVKWNGSIAVDI